MVFRGITNSGRFPCDPRVHLLEDFKKNWILKLQTIILCRIVIGVVRFQKRSVAFLAIGFSTYEILRTYFCGIIQIVYQIMDRRNLRRNQRWSCSNGGHPHDEAGAEKCWFCQANRTIMDKFVTTKTDDKIESRILNLQLDLGLQPGEHLSLSNICRLIPPMVFKHRAKPQNNIHSEIHPAASRGSEKQSSQETVSEGIKSNVASNIVSSADKHFTVGNGNPALLHDHHSLDAQREMRNIEPQVPVQTVHKYKNSPHGVSDAQNQFTFGSVEHRPAVERKTESPAADKTVNDHKNSSSAISYDENLFTVLSGQPATTAPKTGSQYAPPIKINCKSPNASKCSKNSEILSLGSSTARKDITVGDKIPASIPDRNSENTKHIKEKSKSQDAVKNNSKCKNLSHAVSISKNYITVGSGIHATVPHRRSDHSHHKRRNTEPPTTVKNVKNCEKSSRETSGEQKHINVESGIPDPVFEGRSKNSQQKKRKIESKVADQSVNSSNILLCRVSDDLNLSTILRGQRSNIPDRHSEHVQRVKEKSKSPNAIKGETNCKNSTPGNSTEKKVLIVADRIPSSAANRQSKNAPQVKETPKPQDIIKSNSKSKNSSPAVSTAKKGITVRKGISAKASDHLSDHSNHKRRNTEPSGAVKNVKNSKKSTCEMSGEQKHIAVESVLPATVSQRRTENSQQKKRKTESTAADKSINSSKISPCTVDDYRNLSSVVNGLPSNIPNRHPEHSQRVKEKSESTDAIKSETNCKNSTPGVSTAKKGITVGDGIASSVPDHQSKNTPQVKEKSKPQDAVKSNSKCKNCSSAVSTTKKDITVGSGISTKESDRRSLHSHHKRRNTEPPSAVKNVKNSEKSSSKMSGVQKHITAVSGIPGTVFELRTENSQQKKRKTESTPAYKSVTNCKISQYKVSDDRNLSTVLSGKPSNISDHLSEHTQQVKEKSKSPDAIISETNFKNSTPGVSTAKKGITVGYDISAHVPDRQSKNTPHAKEKSKPQDAVNGTSKCKNSSPAVSTAKKDITVGSGIPATVPESRFNHCHHKRINTEQQSALKNVKKSKKSSSEKSGEQKHITVVSGIPATVSERNSEKPQQKKRKIESKTDYKSDNNSKISQCAVSDERNLSTFLSGQPSVSHSERFQYISRKTDLTAIFENGNCKNSLSGFLVLGDPKLFSFGRELHTGFPDGQSALSQSMKRNTQSKCAFEIAKNNLLSGVSTAKKHGSVDSILLSNSHDKRRNTEPPNAVKNAKNCEKSSCEMSSEQKHITAESEIPDIVSERPSKNSQQKKRKTESTAADKSINSSKISPCTVSDDRNLFTVLSGKPSNIKDCDSELTQRVKAKSKSPDTIKSEANCKNSTTGISNAKKDITVGDGTPAYVPDRHSKNTPLVKEKSKPQDAVKSNSKYKNSSPAVSTAKKDKTVRSGITAKAPDCRSFHSHHKRRNTEPPSAVKNGKNSEKSSSEMFDAQKHITVESGIPANVSKRRSENSEQKKMKTESTVADKSVNKSKISPCTVPDDRKISAVVSEQPSNIPDRNSEHTQRLKEKSESPDAIKTETNCKNSKPRVSTAKKDITFGDGIAASAPDRQSKNAQHLKEKSKPQDAVKSNSKCKDSSPAVSTAKKDTTVKSGIPAKASDHSNHKRRNTEQPIAVKTIKNNEKSSSEMSDAQKHITVESGIPANVSERRSENSQKKKRKIESTAADKSVTNCKNSPCTVCDDRNLFTVVSRQDSNIPDRHHEHTQSVKEKSKSPYAIKSETNCTNSTTGISNAKKDITVGDGTPSSAPARRSKNSPHVKEKSKPQDAVKSNSKCKNSSPAVSTAKKDKTAESGIPAKAPDCRSLHSHHKRRYTEPPSAVKTIKNNEKSSSKMSDAQKHITVESGIPANVSERRSENSEQKKMKTESTLADKSVNNSKISPCTVSDDRNLSSIVSGQTSNIHDRNSEHTECIKEKSKSSDASKSETNCKNSTPGVSNAQKGITVGDGTSSSVPNRHSKNTPHVKEISKPQDAVKSNSKCKNSSPTVSTVKKDITVGSGMLATLPDRSSHHSHHKRMNTEPPSTVKNIEKSEKSSSEMSGEQKHITVASGLIATVSERRSKNSQQKKGKSEPTAADKSMNNRKISPCTVSDDRNLSTVLSGQPSVSHSERFQYISRKTYSTAIFENVGHCKNSLSGFLVLGDPKLFSFGRELHTGLPDEHSKLSQLRNTESLSPFKTVKNNLSSGVSTAQKHGSADSVLLSTSNDSQYEIYQTLKGKSESPTLVLSVKRRLSNAECPAAKKLLYNETPFPTPV